jgi:hypothetical protein
MRQRKKKTTKKPRPIGKIAARTIDALVYALRIDKFKVAQKLEREDIVLRLLYDVRCATFDKVLEKNESLVDMAPELVALTRPLPQHVHDERRLCPVLQGQALNREEQKQQNTHRSKVVSARRARMVGTGFHASFDVTSRTSHSHGVYLRMAFLMLRRTALIAFASTPTAVDFATVLTKKIVMFN